MEFFPEFLADTAGKEFVAGGLGGMAGVVAGHPLDTLRIRMQQPRIIRSVAGPSFTAILSKLVAAEGPMALFKGMTAPLAAVAFQNAVSFQTYAGMCRILADGQKDEALSYGKVAVAGVTAGTVQTLILTPVDLIKIRLQLMTERVTTRSSIAVKQPGPWDVIGDIVRKEGFKGMYRGLGVTVLRDAPSHAVYFGTYEYTREWLHPGCRQSGQESLMTMLTAGGLAGVLSWIGCYPLDVVKSRLQAQHGKGVRYTGIIDCVQKSVREEGMQVLFRGLGTAVARAYLVNGAIFSAYEMTLRFMSRSPPQDLSPRPAQDLGLKSTI